MTHEMAREKLQRRLELLDEWRRRTSRLNRKQVRQMRSWPRLPDESVLAADRRLLKEVR